MDNTRSTATSEGSMVNEWKKYCDVTREPSYGLVLGLCMGIKGKDVYGSGSSQRGRKRNGRTASSAWNLLLINCNNKYLLWFKQYCKVLDYLIYH